MRKPAEYGKLAEARLAAGFTQRDLADAAGVSLSLIARLEQGTHSNMTVKTARALAKALHMRPAALMGLL